jgi:hypothetical protein
MEVSGEVHALAALSVKIRAFSIRWLGGRVGPTAGLDTAEKAISGSSDSRTHVYSYIPRASSRSLVYTGNFVTAVRTVYFKGHSGQDRAFSLVLNINIYV